MPVKQLGKRRRVVFPDPSFWQSSKMEDGNSEPGRGSVCSLQCFPEIGLRRIAPRGDDTPNRSESKLRTLYPTSLRPRRLCVSAMRISLPPMERTPEASTHTVERSRNS